MSTTSVGAPADWVLCGEVQRLLAVDMQAVFRLAADGHIGTLKIPRTRTRYFRPDVERLLAESARPATAGRRPEAAPAPA